mmetsp:Transcript_9802/g.21859  ORF Transcript_9802/g.21859 Transcript_9802/m.21859 type:complete len:205 (+) Transcript_9802:543-1157(+)
MCQGLFELHDGRIIAMILVHAVKSITGCQERTKHTLNQRELLTILHALLCGTFHHLIIPTLLPVGPGIVDPAGCLCMMLHGCFVPMQHLPQSLLTLEKLSNVQGALQLRWRQMPVPQRVDALEEVRRSAAGQRRVQLREARGPLLTAQPVISIQIHFVKGVGQRGPLHQQLLLQGFGIRTCHRCPLPQGRCSDHSRCQAIGGQI